MDGDGDLDIVEGNIMNTNRIYLNHINPPSTGEVLYNTAAGRVTSTSIITEEVNNVLIENTEFISDNTSIDYWVSNNGGGKWYQVWPGTPFVFPASGSDLRWWANLRSLSPVATPRINELTFSTDTTPPIVDMATSATNSSTPKLVGTASDAWGVKTVEVDVSGSSYPATVSSST